MRLVLTDLNSIYLYLHDLRSQEKVKQRIKQTNFVEIKLCTLYGRERN